MGWISRQQQNRDHNGLRNVCAACGNQENKENPLVNTTDGWRVHKSHTEDPNDGFYNQQQ